MSYLLRRATHHAHISKRQVLMRCTLKLFALTMIVSLVPVGSLNRAQASGDCLLDPTFDRDGKVITDVAGSFDIAHDLVIQPDGKIILVGLAGGAGVSHNFGLVRYNPDGQLDQSFGNKGKVTTKFPSGNARAFSVALQPDGKIVAAGEVALFNNLESADFALARYRSDGSLDTTFGSDGTIITDFFNNGDSGQAVAIQSDGKIVAAGYATVSTQNFEFALARYNSDGHLDTTFGFNGKVSTSFFGGRAFLDDMILQPDGKIVGVGSDGDGNEDHAALARYLSDGSLDNTFGGDGRVVSNGKAILLAAALQPDGKIVAVGQGVDFQLGQFSSEIVRYKSNGQLDTMFGNGGSVVTSEIRFPRDITLQPDGKIIFAGSESGDFALARYSTNGQVDQSFGTGGKILTDFYCGDNDEATAVALQPDGKIVAGGFASFNPDRDGFGVVRYNNDGAPAQPTLLSVALSRTTTPGCQSLTGVVTLCAPAAAGGLEVKLTDNLGAATLPASVMVPAGASTACFTIDTTTVSSTEVGNIVAKLNGAVRSATLIVRPVAIASLSFSPNPVAGPNPTSGTVELECPAPAGGLTVQLSSRNPGVASPTRSSIRIPAGSTRASFGVQTADVSATRLAVITATVNGISKRAVLTVN